MSTPTPTTDSHASTHRRTTIKNAVLLGISAVLFALAAWIFLNRQYVMDEIRLYRYTPPAEIQQIVDTTTMHQNGERYFSASQPVINNRQHFNENCSDHGEQTIVLGCYKDFNIYIFDVKDPRLPGVKDATAAHEMLHAAYDRLSGEERRRIDGLIQAEAARIADPRLSNLVKLYNATEPGVLPNEMHSIIGTEVRDISPELERYYARYFADRKKVVELSENYEKVFSDLKKQQDELSAELDRLNEEIRRRTDSLNNDIAQLNRDIADFNRRANEGEFSSQAEFQAERDELASRQAALSSERRSINELISRFNSVRQQLADLNLQAQSLNQSLDSAPNEVPDL